MGRKLSPLLGLPGGFFAPRSPKISIFLENWEYFLSWAFLAGSPPCAQGFRSALPRGYSTFAWSIEKKSGQPSKAARLVGDRLQVMPALPPGWQSWPPQYSAPALPGLTIRPRLAAGQGVYHAGPPGLPSNAGSHAPIIR